jgi:hypothetical protein
MKKKTHRAFGIIILSAFLALSAGAVAASSDGHHKTPSDRMGDLFHESLQDGYMLSYYLMDMRGPKEDKASDSHAAGHDHSGHDKKEMDRPHHIMVYIMDPAHAPVTDAQVEFVIKSGTGMEQKIKAAYMSQGFGIMADMKQEGVYEITTHVAFTGVTLMDRFDHEMK